MTGHQVYSTLHTNSALGAVPRLLDLGLHPDILAGNIVGVVAQRLVRKLCVHCREPYEAGDFERRLLGSDAPVGAVTLWQAKGCARCHHQGYKGRLALMEVLKFDEEMDELLARRATARELLNAALAKGFRTLADDGVRRALEGATSLDEVSRVVDLTARLR
jgi:general secretion pathway protein E/type IV pilus assembly protein PilB